jgi:hypothetical protein
MMGALFPKDGPLKGEALPSECPHLRFVMLSSHSNLVLMIPTKYHKKKERKNKVGHLKKQNARLTQAFGFYEMSCISRAILYNEYFALSPNTKLNRARW